MLGLRGRDHDRGDRDASGRGARAGPGCAGAVGGHADTGLGPGRAGTPCHPGAGTASHPGQTHAGPRAGGNRSGRPVGPASGDAARGAWSTLAAASDRAGRAAGGPAAHRGAIRRAAPGRGFAAAPGDAGWTDSSAAQASPGAPAARAGRGCHAVSGAGDSGGSGAAG